MDASRDVQLSGFDAGGEAEGMTDLTLPVLGHVMSDMKPELFTELMEVMGKTGHRDHANIDEEDEDQS